MSDSIETPAMQQVLRLAQQDSLGRFAKQNLSKAWSKLTKAQRENVISRLVIPQVHRKAILRRATAESIPKEALERGMRCLWLSRQLGRVIS